MRLAGWHALHDMALHFIALHYIHTYIHSYIHTWSLGDIIQGRVNPELGQDNFWSASFNSLYSPIGLSREVTKVKW